MKLTEIATDEAFSMMSLKEAHDLELALAVAEQHGHGNVMAWIAASWAATLVSKDGMKVSHAIDAVSGRGPYLHPLSTLKPKKR